MRWYNYDGIPSNFFQITPLGVEKEFKGPSVFHIKGREERPFIFSTLLHGNETTGFFALQKFLEYYWDNELTLPRSVIIILGNPAAAAKSKRHLDDQPDFNRIWTKGETPWHKLAEDLMTKIEEYNPLACVDIHNTSGKNPKYGCVSKKDDLTLKLAGLFHSPLIYVTEPSEVFMSATSKFCPSVTLECGKPGDLEALNSVVEYLKDLIETKPEHLPEYNGDVYKTIARLKIPQGAWIDFIGKNDPEVNFSFIPQIEKLNFNTVPKGQVLAKVNGKNVIEVLDDNNNNISDQYFEIVEDQMVFKKEAFPSMFSTSIEVVKSDVLGYLMEKVEL
ncbi:MAG: succinylglutamate desuccinylase/aspartoacylase family protein [Bacteriovoracaceae bacterium]|nr:succinylglutamate desuccinylase/aspartoacylase family protein [Bacteriovoracaceae bacterium]